MIEFGASVRGASSGEFEQQIAELRPFLEQNWRAAISPRTAMPLYERPVVLVLYREDHRFLLDSTIPRPGQTEANFDLVIASQPYRALSSVNFRAKRIIAPLARALRAGGRLIGIHSRHEAIDHIAADRCRGDQPAYRWIAGSGQDERAQHNTHASPRPRRGGFPCPIS